MLFEMNICLGYNNNDNNNNNVNFIKFEMLATWDVWWSKCFDLYYGLIIINIYLPFNLYNCASM